MSLLDKLPKIVEQGRKTAEQILEGLQGKQKIALQTRELVYPAKDTLIGDMFRQNKLQTEDPFNRLIYGDNLLAMAALLSGDSGTDGIRGKVDLVYIDPPFDSKADYRTRVKLPSGDIEQKPTVIEQYAYSDTWKDGTESYLEMITPRLFLIKELLSDKGSVLIHLDWHVGHYVKVIADEIFGKDNFINEIIWKRTFAHGDTGQGASHLGRVHDAIFLYKKGETPTFNQTYTPYAADYIEKHFRYIEEGTGRRFQSVSLTGPGGAAKGNPYYEFLGVKRYWQFSESNMYKLLDDGKIYQSKPNESVPRRKMYLDESKGIPLQDIWVDIAPVQGQAKEYLDYATQKPEALLSRFISLLTNEGDLVADFFGGSGTTAAVCEKMNRRWIVSDLGKPSCMVMRKRFIDMDAKPFLYQAIGDYQVETIRSTLGKRFAMGELARIVVELYGALPLSQDNNPNKDRGYIGKTLVICDSPNKITGLPTLKKAQALRDQLMGGWDKVVVLGWNFAPDIGHSVTQLSDERLEVLVIPPDLMDRMRKKGGFDKLKDSIRFSSLQYLTASQPKITYGEKHIVEIELTNYVLLSPEAINLDEANRKNLQKIINSDPLSLVEYWAVDTNYDGELFRSVWQDYRGNTDKDDDDLHVVRKAVIQADPIEGKRRICIRAVDVFGFESEVEFEV